MNCKDYRLGVLTGRLTDMYIIALYRESRLRYLDIGEMRGCGG